MVLEHLPTFWTLLLASIDFPPIVEILSYGFTNELLGDAVVGSRFDVLDDELTDHRFQQFVNNLDGCIIKLVNGVEVDQDFVVDLLGSRLLLGELELDCLA